MAVKPEKIIPKFQQICAKESEFAMTGGLLKKPRGAPPRLFEPDMGEAVLKYIGEGYSLNQALQKVPGAPCWSTFWDWIYDAEKCPVSPQHAAFGQAISRARKKQAAAFFDQCIEIANDKSNDLIKRVDKHGNEQDTPNPVAVARAKLPSPLLGSWLRCLPPARYPLMVASVTRYNSTPYIFNVA